MRSGRSWRCWSPDRHMPQSTAGALPAVDAAKTSIQTNNGAGAGVSPMTDKSNFTPDEWKLLLESVMMAGIAVTAAEPSGLWGLLKESFASGSALVSAKMDPGSNQLIKAVVTDFETADGRSITRDGLKKEIGRAHV